MRLPGILYFFIFFFSFFPSFQAGAQESEEKQDSLVRLIRAEKLKQLESDGMLYRKAEGSVAFLHNDTYLLCDTAVWNVDRRIIDAIGNVKIIQERTELQSDKMKYYIDRDLAEFRGVLVQLQDKDKNTLRTMHLDYNTKDSVAVFRDGGSMRDKDGQIIESNNGTYDSKIKTFTFIQDVNMFSDSIFVVTSRLKYESDRNMAYFGRGTNAWKDDNMLSSDNGWYDRNREVFLFTENVHLMSEVQEGWCDSLYFYRVSSDVNMLGNAQLIDTTRNVSAVAGSILYNDSESKVTLTRKPAVIAETLQDNIRDTVYLGADTLIYLSMRKCDIDSAMLDDAALRIANLNIDPVSEFRKKAAQEAAAKAEEAAKNDPNNPKYYQKPPGKPKNDTRKTDSKPAPASGGTVPAVTDSLAANISSQPLNTDSLSFKSDSLGIYSDSLADSLSLVDSLSLADSLAVPIEPDTSKLGFVTAVGNVKLYKSDMQAVCDSLLYSDLDSLARMFKEPVIWNEINRQYAADSITIVVKNNTMEKASLMSNAFIIIQEDTSHFDQIRSTEMMAYFDDQVQLKRFDALGEASALFYIEEQDVLATVNRKESKMLSATFKDGAMHRIYYYDTIKSDAFPIVQMTPEDQKFKGFNWIPERRPADRNAVTPLQVRASQRKKYSSVPKAEYVNTDHYFPGYMEEIYRQIEERDSLRAVRERERIEAERLAEIEKERIADSLAVADSLVKADSLAAIQPLADSTAVDSISVQVISDTVSVADSSPVLDKKAEKQRKKELRERKRQEKIARKEARWKALDEAELTRKQQKKARLQEKINERISKQIKDAEEQALKDAALLEKYKEKYRKKLERKKKLPENSVVPENIIVGETVTEPQTD